MTVCLRNNLKEYDTRSGIGNVLGRSYQFSFFIKSKVKDTKWNNFNHNSNIINKSYHQESSQSGPDESDLNLSWDNPMDVGPDST